MEDERIDSLESDKVPDDELENELEASMALYFSQPEDRDIHLDELNTVLEKLENKDKMSRGRALWNKLFSTVKGIFAPEKKSREMEVAEK